MSGDHPPTRASAGPIKPTRRPATSAKPAADPLGVADLPAGDAKPGAGSQPGGARQVRQVVALARPWRSYLRYGAASALLQQVLFIAGAGLAAYAAGRAALGSDYGSLVFYVIGLLVIVLLQVRPPWLESISFQFISNRVQVELRSQVYDALQRLTPGGLAGRRSGELGSAALTDVSVVQRFFAETLSVLLVASIVPILAVAAVAVLSWQLALVLVVFLALATNLPLALHARSERHGRRLRQQQAALSAEVVDDIQGLREALTFGADTALLDELRERSRGMHRLQQVRSRQAAAETMATELISTVGALSVLVVGAGLVAHHQLSRTFVPPAVVVAALSFGPVSRLVEAVKRLGEVGAASERIFGLVGAPAPVTDRTTAASADEASAASAAGAADEAGTAAAADEAGTAGAAATAAVEAVAPGAAVAKCVGSGTAGMAALVGVVAVPARPGVAWRDVCFRYRPDLPLALDGVSFDVAPGESVALVGHSGAGKSTCVSLLLRFWDVESGQVCVGGVDVRELPQRDLHRLVGFVPQDVYLFNSSVRENLRLGRPDASDAEIEAACRAAVAWEFIDAMPDGLDSETGERGVQLSGGQRQRLAVARALLADPPVLVLDEPVSNLDSENERALTEAMARLRRGRATLIVAHRLSTIQNADRVVVLDHGHVAETGTHRTLLARGGTYATLVAAQLSAI